MHVEQTLTHAAIGLYLAALALYVVSFFLGAARIGRAATAGAWLGFICQAVVLGLRWSRAGHMPLVSMYEYLTAFAAMVVVCYLVFERKQRGWGTGAQALGVVAMVISVALLGYALRLPAPMKETEPLMPVLRSYWLVFHVSMAVVGYGAAALASAVACLFFLRAKWGEEGSWLHGRLPSLATLDQATYRSVRFAFPFLTMLNVTGAVWAYYAWGRYWGWDPKETWSLITWLIYVFYFHARLHADWHPRRLNSVVLIGLAAILFTFLGVNQLAAFSESLHSYAPAG
jgi:cytochrome c-type biogenesis protein CcsB